MYRHGKIVGARRLLTSETLRSRCVPGTESGMTAIALAGLLARPLTRLSILVGMPIKPSIRSTQSVRAVFLTVGLLDGTRIVSGGGDRMVRLWEANTGRLIQAIHADSHRINSLAFSPDGTSPFGWWGQHDETVGRGHRLALSPLRGTLRRPFPDVLGGGLARRPHGPF
jgi:hypothetical protein